MTPPKILIIGRELAEVEAHAEFLSAAGGFEAHVENRLSAAVATAEETQPRVIVVDMDSPFKDGRDLVARFRSHRLFKESPLIVLSEQLDLQSDSACNTVMLPKPVSLLVLLRAVAILAKRTCSPRRSHTPVCATP